MKSKLILFLVLNFLGGMYAQAPMDKVATELLASDTVSGVIVHFNPAPAMSAEIRHLDKITKGEVVYQHLAGHAAETQERARLALDSAGIAYRAFCVSNVIYIEDKMSTDMLAKLVEDGNVRRVTSNDVIRRESVREAAPVRSGALEWGLERIGVQDVWDMGYRGQGVVVGGQDTGFEWDHPALKKSYRGFDGATVDHNYSWYDAIHILSPLHMDGITDPDSTYCGVDTVAPCDDNGHGTHTMGTIVGEDGDNLIGAAPEAQWVGVRCMERGWGSPITYIEGFEWFLAPTDVNGENPDPAMAPDVINNSWRCPEVEGCNSDNFEMMRQAVANLRQAGVFVVVSAGNEGRDGCSSINYPAAMFAESFVVGATSRDDSIASFSSRGPITIDSSGRMKPDISAPGVAVRSAFRFEGYRALSGTSMAGPHIAGTVALILSARPDLAGQVDLLEEIIRLTARPVVAAEECGEDQSMIPNNTYGAGIVDANAAVQLALGITSTALPEEKKNTPRLFPNPASDQVNVLRPADVSSARIYDYTGRLVKTIRRVDTPVDISHLHPGVYAVQIEGDSGVEVERLVVGN